jgi:hypothetical protein
MRSSASNVNVNVANGSMTPREEMKEVNPIKQNLVDSINKEDYQSIRNVLSFVNKIKESGEFPEIENE